MFESDVAQLFLRLSADRAAGGSTQLRHIALIGNASPRRCGLATFTSHVADALALRFPNLTVDHYAMDDGSGVAYPDHIRTINAADPEAYRRAGAEIAASGAEAVWVQHEFGIFGGDAGSHLFELLEMVNLPVIATLHTVLKEPSPAERLVFERLLRRADHLIVMARTGQAILHDVYGVDDSRISVIPHGVPDRPLVDPDEFKARLGLSGRSVITTFGLLAPDKGVRHMIEAMPEIVAGHPDSLYLVIGASHPNLVRREGEAHREELLQLCRNLGVGDHVRFIDSFVEQEELLDLLQASDIYVTPYLNMKQVTSGTLSYAVAVGKPVVSTPYVHASELLADDHGILVPPNDSSALAAAVGGLLNDRERRLELGKRAYARGRAMLWPRTVEQAIDLLRRPAPAPMRSRRSMLAGSGPALDAVVRMTDSTGMYQHGIFTVPDRAHGYCVDDNARALMLMVRLAGSADPLVKRLTPIYAAFVQNAWNPDARRFRNFMHFDRRWLEDVGSEDSNGRSLWAISWTAAHSPSAGLRAWARDLFDCAAPMASEFTSPRSLAFAALGAFELLKAQPGDDHSRSILADAGSLLLSLLVNYSRPDWNWFEPRLAYDNARLPEALIRAGMALGNDEMVARGIATLDWLIGVQTGPRGVFRPVGSRSFGRDYARPLAFDQQPLEAQATIDAAAAAFAATGDNRWLDIAHSAWGWFFGDNEIGAPLASQSDGGCFDGLMATGVNRNQGAESILAFHLSSAAISALSFARDAFKTPPESTRGRSGTLAPSASLPGGHASRLQRSAAAVG